MLSGSNMVLPRGRPLASLPVPLPGSGDVCLGWSVFGTLGRLADVRRELKNHVIDDVRDEFSTPRTYADGQPTSAWGWAGWVAEGPII